VERQISPVILLPAGERRPRFTFDRLDSPHHLSERQPPPPRPGVRVAPVLCENLFRSVTLFPSANLAHYLVASTLMFKINPGMQNRQLQNRG
jgi:hypothetical protein